MTYSKKLQDPRWQRKRLEILQRDDFSCQACGADDKTLHVHHRYYRQSRDPWDYDDTALVAVCDECHDGIHESKEQFEEVLAKMPFEVVDCLIESLLLIEESARCEWDKVRSAMALMDYCMNNLPCPPLKRNVSRLAESDF